MNRVLIFILKCRFIFAFLVRLGFIIVSQICQTKYDWNYTDIDYHVVSDGARHLFSSEGPYKRETYRYSPILAIMMIPNLYIHYEISKVVMSIIDVWIGKLIEDLLTLQEAKDIKLKDKYDYRFISLFDLFNHLPVYISTRGSSDCIITFLVMLTIILIEMNQTIPAGIIYGLSVHLKIYPIIYFPSLYLYIGYKNLNKIDSEKKIEGTILSKLISKVLNLLNNMKKIFKNLMNVKSILFTIFAGSTFAIIFFFFFLIYGRIFVYETYLYHFIRKDHRHNYSLYFYMIYLNYASYSSKILSYIAFLPQFLLVIYSSIKLYPRINFCLFVQTVIFVTFNKVVTAQYFIWYMSLLPLLIPYNELFKSKKLFLTACFTVWTILVIMWALYSVILEDKGVNVFLEIWGSTIAFFMSNCYCLMQLIKYQD